MIFPEVRGKEIVLAEAEIALTECRAMEKGDDQKLFFYRTVRPLIDEYYTEVLDTFETEDNAVRIYKYGNRYYVTTFEYHYYQNIRSSMQGTLFFGGTEDESAAWAKFEEYRAKYSEEAK